MMRGSRYFYKKQGGQEQWVRIRVTLQQSVTPQTDCLSVIPRPTPKMNKIFKNYETDPNHVKMLRKDKDQEWGRVKPTRFILMENFWVLLVFLTVL